MEKLTRDIKNLKNNEKIANIINSKTTPNFWDVIEYGGGSYETRYSRMLRWLLDGEENHGLGNKFAQEFFSLCESKRKTSQDADQASLSGSAKGQVSYPLRKSSQVEALGENIDIFYNNLDFPVKGSNNKTEANLLVMEVKHLADEHMTEKNGRKMSQLEKYAEAIYDHEKYSFQNYENKYFVFLTIDGHEAPSIAEARKKSKLEEWQKLWISMAYKELIEIIGSILKNETYITMDSMKLIKDFKNDLERQTFSSVEKEVLNKIYSDNKAKLTELYNFYFPAYEEEDEEKEIAYEDIFKIEKEVNNPMLKEYVRLIYDSAHIQDHTPNTHVQSVIKKMLERLRGEGGGDLTKPAGIKESWKKVLDLDQLRLTIGKGQGLYLIKEENNKTKAYKIYFSGDKEGNLPNDALHVRNHRDLNIANGNFRNKNGKRYNPSDLVEDELLFDEFFEDYIDKVKSLQEIIKADKRFAKI